MGSVIGPLHVRRSIFIEAPPARVWQEFETSERICGWLDRGHTVHAFEPRIGGSVRMSVEIDGEQRFYGGEVLRLEPGRELTLSSQWDEPYHWPVPIFWTIRLTGLYGGTLVELFHHGFERLGALAADNLQGYESGWDGKHLEALRNIVEG